MMRRKLVFITCIFLLGLAIKLAGAFLLPVFHDVGWYRALTLFQDSAFMNLIQLEHPPLGYYFFLIVLKLFGIKDYVIRLVPLFFSLLQLLLIYWLCKKFYNDKIAKYTIILWSLTFFSYVNALSPEGDGSIMAFFSIFLFYFFYKYFESKNKKYVLLTGLFYGLLMLIKARAVLFIIPLALYTLYKLRTMKESFLFLFKVSIIGLIIFSLFPLTLHITSPDEAGQLIKQVIIHNTGRGSILYNILYKITHPMIFLQVFTVISPLLIYLFLKGIKECFKDGLKDFEIMLFLWFSSLLITLLALLPTGGLAAVYPRYISFLLPPLLILSAKGLNSLKLSNKKLVAIISLSFVLYIITLIFNQTSTNYWFYSSAAAGVYKLNKWLLIFYLTTPFLLIIANFLIRKRFNNLIIFLFLIISLAFNIHFILEPIVDQTHPKIINDFKNFYFYNKESIKKPLFFWAEDLAFYLESDGLNIKMFTNPQLKSYAEKIGYNSQGHFIFDLNDEISIKELKEKGGTVFMLYIPKKYMLLSNDLNRGKEEAFFTEKCKLLKSFIYKTGRGDVWEC